MNRRGLPDLSRLNEAQKDELIVDLWETLLAVERAGPPDRAAAAVADEPARGPRLGELRDRIRAAAPSSRAQASVPARTGGLIRLLHYRPLQILLLLIALGFLADLGISWHQRRLTAIRDAAVQRLHQAAFAGLYVELAQVAHEPDGRSYRATLNMQNTRPDARLYIMLNPVRVFVQAGLSWREVPSRPPADTAWGVVDLDDARAYSVLFEADLQDWSQLIPGYMHVLLQSDMMISQRSEPTDDLVERSNRFYVYLKPHGADDASIRRRSNFPGTPPVFIPMPPH